jgi:hypothetical protein
MADTNNMWRRRRDAHGITQKKREAVCNAKQMESGIDGDGAR